MLSKKLLSVRIYRGNILPRYAELTEGNLYLAKEVIKTYFLFRGRKKKDLEEELSTLETRSTYKLLRALSSLLSRRCQWSKKEDLKEDPKLKLKIKPKELRQFLFQRGYVISKEERERVLEEVVGAFGLLPGEIEEHFWADSDGERVLVEVSPPSSSPDTLLKEYNLSLTQTLLFNALSLRFSLGAGGSGKSIRSLIRRIKRLGLMYEALEEDTELWFEVTGPSSFVKDTTRYGTRLARIIPQVMRHESWNIKARIKTARGIFNFALEDSKRHIFPSWEKAKDKKDKKDKVEIKEKEELFDSSFEEEFWRRLGGILKGRRGWLLVREPRAFKSGKYIFIPDFSIEKKDRKYYIEIVGFWTEDYLRRKMEKIKGTNVPMMVFVNRRLSCSQESFEGDDKEVVFFDKRLPLEPLQARIKDLDSYFKERDLEKLRKGEVGIEIEGSVVSLDELSDKYEVEVEALREFLKVKETLAGKYELVGDKIVGKEILGEIKARIDTMGTNDYFEAKKVLEEYGLGEATLANVGYKVEWKSLFPPEARLISL